jgi:hypothetical protein
MTAPPSRQRIKLKPGAVVRCRTRRYLVEEVQAPQEPGADTVVALACMEDDAIGSRLTVFREREIDFEVLGESSWEAVAQRGFDQPRQFSAYLNTLRWNCVTATDAELFQAPYRAGIDVKAYQLEPLRKALLMPRVGLFIADDVGLGKTIEAGLILREMLLRQRIRRVVISCPPSVLRQWQEEMASRFGLAFTVMDRAYLAKVRQERGYGANPWSTASRFLISHALLRNPEYSSLLRVWLEEGKGGADQAPLQSLLILDEAHNAAPASNSLRYAIDSGLTRSLRDLAPLFEHRIFLSATPHNGHSNSFTALLELLDPARFVRGVPFDPKDLDTVLVRRLKDDLRRIGEEFPERIVEPLAIPRGSLPPDTPELKLSRLLQNYRKQREERLIREGAGKRELNAERLVITNLQKRLLSSIEAFARTLEVHQRSLAEKQEQRRGALANDGAQLDLLLGGADRDSDLSELSEDDLLNLEEAQMRAALRQTVEADQGELELLKQMGESIPAITGLFSRRWAGFSSVSLAELGVARSFSRPRVSNDNAYAESQFRTMKYHQSYPVRRFRNLDVVRCWVDGFVEWYNGEHRHSGIKYVTPNQRHFGEADEICAIRQQTYEKACQENPRRWTRPPRSWKQPKVVKINHPRPEKHDCANKQ